MYNMYTDQSGGLKLVYWSLRSLYSTSNCFTDFSKEFKGESLSVCSVKTGMFDVQQTGAASLVMNIIAPLFSSEARSGNYNKSHICMAEDRNG